MNDVVSDPNYANFNYYPFSSPPDTDLDSSFTTTTSTTSARTSLARSSLTLSFNESHLSTSSSTIQPTRPHRKSHPNWSAINAAINLSSAGSLQLNHLKLIRHLGTGNLGRVFLCRLRDYDYATFALKVVDRESLSLKKLEHVQMEADILSSLDHPFLPTLYAHLEVSHYTCFLIDYCSGGDLHTLLRRQPLNRLPIESVRFFAAEVLVALEYLHALGIVYRDLKPENVLLRDDGHVMLSDFDLCFKSDVIPKLNRRFKVPGQTRTRKSRSPRSNCFRSGSGSRVRNKAVVTEFVAEPTSAYSKSCVGTHEYLAPELVTCAGHGSGVDWWAFGVFIYELLHGTTPFKGANKDATLRNIGSKGEVVFPEYGDGVVSDEAKDLITRLLVKNPKRRLGAEKGAVDIKRHPFFEGIKWPLIRNYRPPVEVRGMMRRSSGGGSQFLGKHQVVMSPRRRWWWKGLLSYLVRSKGSKRNYSNSNYHYNDIRRSSSRRN